MATYQSLSVKPVINACTTMTYLGGSLMPDEVVLAMQQASKSFVNIHDLHLKVGAHLAALTKNEAAYITTGCAAAIVLSLLGLKTKGDPEKIKNLPQDLQTDEVLIQNTQQIPYFPAISLAKCKAVLVGSDTEVTKVNFLAKIGPNTIATLFVAGNHLNKGGLNLETVVKICKSKKIRVIVDAAAQLPPVENFWKFTKDAGADLALFSGGKALLGPQSSGLMVGASDMIDWARKVGAPNQTLARSMKVGKEEIMGLATAVERYLKLDHSEQWQKWSNHVDFWVNELNQKETIIAKRLELNEAGQPVPRALIKIENPLKIDLFETLLNYEPSIAVLANDENSFYISPDLLTDQEVKIVTNAIIKLFS